MDVGLTADGCGAYLGHGIEKRQDASKFLWKGCASRPIP